MPYTRGAGRRASSRLQTSEPDDNPGSSPVAAPLPALSRPNLPKLAGTPASRRQYTYGSAAEPPPSRPGRGIRMDQQLDLGSAVGDILSRHQREDQASSRKEMPPPPRPRFAAEEDELSNEGLAEPEPQTRRPGRPKKFTTRQKSEDIWLEEAAQTRARESATSQQPTRQQLEDMRDDRSFGTESDYYGNASIRSSPAPTSVASTRSTRKAAQKKASSLRQEAPLEVVQEIAPVVEESLPPPAVEEEPPAQPEPEPAQERQATRLDANLPGRRRNEVQYHMPPIQPLEEESQQPEPGSVAPLRQATRPEDTLSVRRPRKPSKDPSVEPTQPRSQPQSRPQSQAQSHAPTSSSEVLHTTSESVGASSHFRGTRQPPNRQSEPRSYLSHSSQSEPLSISTQKQAQSYASNHSEADDAMQQHIAAASEADETLTTPLKRAWKRVKNFSPRSTSLPPWLNPEPRQEVRESAAARFYRQPHQFGGQRAVPRIVRQPADDKNGNAGVDWWSLLYPRTYIEVLLRFMDVFTDRIELLMDKLFSFSGSRSFWRRILGILATVLTLTLLVTNASILADVLRSTTDSLPSAPNLNFLPGLSGMVSQVGDFASSIHMPSIAIPSFRGQDDLSSIWELGNDETKELESYFRKFDEDFKDLRSTSNLHDASIEKLEKVLPQIIHVKSSHGKLAIGPDFYYAMRDKLRDDEAIMTFDEKNGDSVVGSDKQWRSLVQGITNDPYLDKKLNGSMYSIENRLDGKMTSFWDSWIKDNDHKITAQLGTALESLKAANSEAELDAIVKKLVKEQIHDSSSASGTLVTREDFIKQVRREVEVNRAEIRAEIDELRPQLVTLIKDTVRLANAENSQREGISKEDTTDLVNSLVRKAIADTNLKAMAQGKIHAHWDADLKNQVNYFTRGAGAVADPKMSSATYDPHNLGLATMEAYAKGLRGAQPLPPLAALQRWDDEGDCWCAAREVNRRGNPHGATLSVLMGHLVIPQHIVIEHILPGATSDPGARPKEIEVHIRIEDPTILSRVQDFSATHFTESDDWNAQTAALGPQFVKVGQFTYEGAELHDGVHVHRLSRELVQMGAETDQLVVRAVSNYGAEGHTCFYRVRLYGERLDG